MIELLLAAYTLVAVESKVPNIPVWLRNAPFLEEVGSCDFIAEYIGERKADKYVFGTLYLHEPSVTGHFLRGQEGSPDEHNTDGSDDGHDGRYYEHTKRPKRHFTLSHHVAFGAMMLVGGLYYALYAFRAGSRIKAEAAALYVLLGMVGVGVGVCTILAFGFAY